MNNANDATPEAVLVSDGLVTEIGSLKELTKLAGGQAYLMDLKGRTLMPSFSDNIVSPSKLGEFSLHSLNLRGVKNIKELQQKIEDYVKNLKPGEWLVGRGFNEVEMEEQQIPTCDDIDVIISDRPVMIFRSCGHIAVVNTYGMRFSNMEQGLRNPKGGTYGRNSEGRLNGIFYETAIDKIIDFFPLPKKEKNVNMIRAGWNDTLSKGITSACDSGVVPSLATAYVEAIIKSKKRVRMTIIPNANTTLRAKHSYSTEKINNDLLHLNSYKYYLDGQLSGKTAAISEKYLDSEDQGALRIEEEIFYDLIYPMYCNDTRMSFHASGDEAITLALDTLEALAKVHDTEVRHRLENLTMLTSKHIEQIKKLNVDLVLSPNDIHDFGPCYRKYLPTNLIDGMLPLKSLIDNKIEFSIGSNGPLAEDVNPFVGIKAAVVRKDKEGELIGAKEAISVKDAMYAYTMGGAKVNGEVDKKGSIEKGKWADLIVLDKDPHEIQSDELDTVVVEQTYIFGALVFSKGNVSKGTLVFN